MSREIDTKKIEGVPLKDGRMTEQEFQKIFALTSQGVSIRQAAGSPARREQFRRMLKRKGIPSLGVAAVIQEATRAANSPVSNDFSVTDTPPTITPPTIKEMYDLAKTVVAKKLRDQVRAGYFSADCIRLCCIFFEKELPEWRAGKSKSAKDEYQFLLEEAFKKSKGFQILERKEDKDDDNTGNAGNPSPR